MFRKQLPVLRCKVVFSEVLPVSSNHHADSRSYHPSAEDVVETNRLVSVVNTALSIVAEAYIDVTCVSHPTINKRHLAKDGLHLNYEGTKLVTGNIECEIRSLKEQLHTRLQVPSYSQVVMSSTAKDRVCVHINNEDVQITQVNRIKHRQQRNRPFNNKTVYIGKHASTRHPKKEEIVGYQQNYAVQVKSVTQPENKQKCFVENRFSLLSVEECDSTTTEECVFTTADTFKDKSVPSPKKQRSSSHRKSAIRTNNQMGGGTSDAVVFMNSAGSLTIDFAHSILRDAADDMSDGKVSKSVPVKPLGGEVYLLDTDALPNKKDALYDRYFWKHDGSKKYPKNAETPKVVKSIYKIRDKSMKNGQSTHFQRHTFKLVQSDRFILIQYIGDSSVVKPVSHGNSKTSTKEYVPTKPSVIDEIKANAEDFSKTASIINRESRNNATSGLDYGLNTSRNVKQVENHLLKARREKRLTQDDIYNMLEISYHLESYVKQIDIFPSLVTIAGLPEIMNEFNELLVNDMGVTLKCYIDTTYKLGDLFVTVFSYQHVIFEGAPIIPVGFMLHEKRDQKYHERFLSVLKQHIPNLGTCKHPIICDREIGISNAIKRVLPSVQIIHCWNHIKQDVKRWLQGRKASKDDIQVYVRHVDTLLRSENSETFFNEFEEKKTVWSQEFVRYFERHLQETITKHSMRQILEKFKIYNHYSGITTNPAESVNNVLKSVQQRRELPSDMILLTLFFTQKYDYTEIQCSRAGIGKHTLKEEWGFAKIDAEDIQVLKSGGSAKEILQHVKNELNSIENKLSFKSSENGSENSEGTEISTTSDNININEENNSKNNETQNTTNTCEQEQDEIIDELNATLILDKEEDERKGREHILSQDYLAEKTIQENKIFFIPSMNAFMVEGVKSTKYVVTLDPKDSCSCPSVGTCYHLLAVKSSFNRTLGKYEKPVKKNLSLLRKNSKPRVAKKTGQKKPRKTDFDVNPAPDSIQATTPKRDYSLALPKTPKSDSKVHYKTPNSENKKSILKRKLSMSAPTSKSKKRIRFDEMNEEENSIDLDISRTDEIPEIKAYWLETYDLEVNDRDLILNDSGWLNDKHMSAVSNILKCQFHKINGFQCTLNVPHYNESLAHWNISKKMMNNEGPSVQIHFNSYNHWIVSYRDTDSNIFVLDSLRSNKTLNSYVKIQLCQIYGDSALKHIVINVPHVQQQTNNSDCGVFAIAFAVELCFNNYVFDNNVRFKIPEMRTHLLNCIENDHFEPFPKISKMPKMPVQDAKLHKIILYCSCKHPACLDDIVKCDNKNCTIQWYHKRCISGFLHDKWICKNCR